MAARTIWSPERPAVSKSVALDGDRDGEKSGTSAASRRPICGEEVEGAAAERSLAVDPSGEERSGEGARRRRRGGRPSRKREREGGGLCGIFTEKSACFLEIAIRSLASRFRGLRVRFSFSSGAFLQKRHRRLLWAVRSTTDGVDRAGTIHYCCLL